MTLRQSARAAGYRMAYRLPGWLRRRLVRAAMPKFIVGSVVILRNPEGNQLMLQRQPPGYGWSVPGGLLERGEQPIAGAARELFEEAGVRVDVADLTPMVPNVIVHSLGRWIDCVFEARVPIDTPLVLAGGEVLEAAWFRLNSLPPLTVATARLLAHYGIGPYVDFPEAREG